MTRTPKQIAADKVAELIEKLEKAETGSRELDAMIYCVEHGHAYSRPYGNDFAMWVDGVPHEVKIIDRYLERYTASLDAAVALAERVLPGWSIFTCLGQTVWPDKPPCWADVGSREFQDDIDGHDQENSTGFAPTLPLALCLAILKAVQEPRP